MNVFTIYHNPQCSKSRQALEILKNLHIEPVIIEYLKMPLTLEQLVQLRSHFNLNELIRYNEPVFKALNLTLDNEEDVLKAVVKEPILLQRPIVVYGDKALIARQVETLLDFCSGIDQLG